MFQWVNMIYSTYYENLLRAVFIKFWSSQVSLNIASQILTLELKINDQRLSDRKV